MRPKQGSFAEARFEKCRKPARREEFLAQMQTLMPWAELVALIEPVYPSGEGAGRPPVGLERMLRIHFLQHKERDPEMHQTKKGNEWRFGMKAHIGVDSRPKIIHSVAASAANVHDSLAIPVLLHGKERCVWGDPACQGQRGVIRKCAKRRAEVELLFLIVKRTFGFTKVRYCGIAKNEQRLFVACALANIFQLCRPLLRLAT